MKKDASEVKESLESIQCQNEKKKRGHIAFLALYSAIGITGLIVGPLIAKSCHAQTSEAGKEHIITIDTSDLGASLYNIQFDKPKVKKGDIVNFILTPKPDCNNNKQPTYIKLNGSSYKLTETEENKKWEVTIVIELVEDMKVKVVLEDTSETFS